MLNSTTLTVFVIALVIGLGFWLLFSAGIIWPWIDGMIHATSRPVEVAHPETVPAPDAIQSAMAQLGEIGFTPIAVTKTTMGEQIGHAWSMASTDKSVIAELNLSGPKVMGQFSTMFEDASCVETMWPFGEVINKKDFQARWTSSSMQDAYRMHRAQVETFAASRLSGPRRCNSPQDIAELEKLYRQKHFRTKLRAGMMRSIRASAYLLVAVVGGAASFALAPILNVDNAGTIAMILGALAVMLLGFGGVVYVFKDMFRFASS